eukprot:379567-Hanusia_phi.AAC.6
MASHDLMLFSWLLFSSLGRVPAISRAQQQQQIAIVASTDRNHGLTGAVQQHTSTDEDVSATAIWHWRYCDVSHFALLNRGCNTLRGLQDDEKVLGTCSSRVVLHSNQVG